MNRTIALTIAGCLSASSMLQAQQFDNAASAQLGGFDLVPTIDIGFRHDDNITRSANDAISSWSRIVSPQLVLRNAFSASEARFGYRLRNETFFSSSQDNYTDHFLFAGVDFELNARHRLDISLNYADEHEARGTGFSTGSAATLTEPDQFKQSDFLAIYSYGAFNAKGRFDLTLQLTNRDYDLDTAVYQARDRRLNTIGGTFFYRVGATTDLTFDAEYTDVTYPFALNPENPLDSQVSSYLIGLDWEATANTSGFAKIGYEQKLFESAQREDFSGVDWAVGLEWEPTEYASVELSTRADTTETNGEGDFIRSRTNRIAWKHDWLERLRTQVSYAWSDNLYEAQETTLALRDDDNQRLRVSSYYAFRRWLNFELSFIRDQRDSNRDIIIYDRNQWLLNAYITL